MKKDIEETTLLLDGVTIMVDNTSFTVKGPKGEIKRQRPFARVDIATEGKIVKLTSKKATKREKKQLYTTLAHLKNMINGVKSPYKYVLKICSGHFPINVSIASGNLVIKNFLG